MLNIPDSVKALFNSDECRKNFRVHFPNGERADLTNSDVVQESVSFSESLCSQNVLRFGLTEASTISFETVGVPNLMGVTIECSCEIDTNSLTAAEIAAIQAGTWDGTLVLAADSDLGYGYFRVPYGRFRVEDCPRNHGAMAHRKVTARTIIGRRDIENPFETAKEALMLPGDTYKPDAYLLTMSGIGWDSPNFLEEQGFTKTTLNGTTVTIPFYSRLLYDTQGRLVSVITSIELDYYERIDITKMHSIDLHGGNYAPILDNMADALRDLGISYELSGYSSFKDLANDLLVGYDFPMVSYNVFEDPSETHSLGGGGSARFSQSNFAFYPFRNSGNAYIRANIFVPRSVTVTLRDTTLEVYTMDSTATVCEYEAPDGMLGNTVLFKATAQIDILGTPMYSFINAFTYMDFVNGFLELSAHFGKPKRDGTYGVIGLSTANPVSVSRSQYEECWWDEYDIEDVGTIRYAYMGSDGQTQEAEFRFGSGRSAYDMTDNAVLLAMENASRQTIESVLRTQFIPNLGTLKFTPVDLSMLGLPYIEAGDYLEIAAEDGTTVRTYALEYELSGIQHLTAEIHSAGGEIIEEG